VAILFVMVSIDRTLSLALLSAHHGKDAFHTFLVLWLRFSPYYLAGYILVKWPMRVRKSAALFCVLICTALLSIITVFAYRMGWEDPYFSYDSLNPFVICASLALFGCFSGIPVSCSPKAHAWLRYLASLTLGIYLVHPLWLRGLHSVGIDGRLLHAAVGIPVATAMALVLSGVTIAAMRGTPFLRRVV
jgi:surface polysaccharide O-acyltransferase-like enzyme